MLGVKLNVKKSKVKIAVINNAEKSGKKALRGGGRRVQAIYFRRIHFEPRSPCTGVPSYRVNF